MVKPFQLAPVPILGNYFTSPILALVQDRIIACGGEHFNRLRPIKKVLSPLLGLHLSSTYTTSPTIVLLAVNWILS